MHRAMNETYSDKIYRKKKRKLHLKRLKNIKCSIDNKPPKQHRHLRQNLKKKQLMEERFARIEHENQLLLQKMSNIMRQNTLDNRNTSLKYARSMNKTSRKKQLAKITKENQQILERIQMKGSTYNARQWENERIQNMKYLQNISQYGVPETLADSRYRRRKKKTHYVEPMDEDYVMHSRERLMGNEYDYDD